MPNWCNNSVTLTAASKEEANELFQHLEKQDEDDWSFFGFFHPEPEYEANEGDAMPDWFWWRVNNWGTKWDAAIHQVDWIDDLTCVMSFDTAWSPPLGIYEAMKEQGWLVLASYYEPGMCFVGRWDDGDDEHYDYSNCSTGDEIREYLPEELDMDWGISEYFDEAEDD